MMWSLCLTTVVVFGRAISAPATACVVPSAAPTQSLAMTVAANDDHSEREIPKLTVRGKAELHVEADELRITLGVETIAAEPQDALEDNNARIEDVINALQKLDLTEKEYETGQFRIQPIYNRRPRRANADWQPQIESYRVQNTLRITTEKLKLAGDMIQAANEAGANRVDSVAFGLSDPRAHRSKAITDATQHALEDARTLARAADVQLIRILKISLDSDIPQPVHVRADMMMEGMRASGASSPSITPGEVDVTASVSIVYEIASNNHPAP